MGEFYDPIESAVRNVRAIDLLREAAAKGWVADFSNEGKAVERLSAKQLHGYLDKEPIHTINAADIRDVLIGLAQGEPVEPDVSSSARRVSAVRLYNVTIVGTLELDDEAGPGGSELPRLEFTKCWFREKQIRLERCRLRSLCLRSCAFTELQASEAVIGGPVVLSYARSAGADLEDRAKCWVVLAGAQIGARINAARSRFVAPKPREQEEWVRYSKHSRYALDLRSTRIRGSINLRPDMSADGGVCLTLSKVEGSIWGNGAFFRAGEEWSFAADYAEVQGTLYFLPYDGPVCGREDKGIPPTTAKDVISEGCMSFFAIKVGGSMYFQGAQLTARDRLRKSSLKEAVPREVVSPSSQEVVRWEETSVLNLSTSTINGYCLFRGWIAEPAKSDPGTGFAKDSKVSHFVGDGDIHLSAAIIRNDLEFGGARVRRINAENIEVLGNCDLGTYSNAKVECPQPFLAWHSVQFTGGHVRGNFVMDGARVGCVANEAGVSLRDMKRTARLIADEGRVASVGDRVIVERTSDMRSFPPPRPEQTNGVFAAGLRVGGSCTLGTFEDEKGEHFFRFECAGKISLEDIKVGSFFSMDGALVVFRTGAAVNLEGAQIGGKASFRTKKGQSGPQLGKGFGFSVWGGDTALKLNGAKMAFGLNLNGAYLEGTRLALAADNIDVGGRASLGTFEIEVTPQRHIPFRFTSKGKVSLVGANIKLQLNLLGARLQRSATHVRTREESGVMDALDMTLLHTKGIHLGKHTCLRDGLKEKERNFRADGRVVFRHASVETDLIVEGCTITRQLEGQFAKIGGSICLSGITVERKFSSWVRLDDGSAGPFCLHKTELEKDFRQRRLTADISLNGASVNGALKVWNDKARQLLDGSPRAKIIVDLRGATVGELDDRGGLAWHRDIRLWLEGFRYSRLTEASAYAAEAVNRSKRKAVRFGLRTIFDPSYFPARREDRHGWQHRAGWLQQQRFYGKRPRIFREKKSESTSDAYEQVITKLKAAGSFEDARRISSIHLWDNAQNSIPNRVLIWFPFRLLFNYGYSVERALITFVLCLVMGVTGAYEAAKHGFLILSDETKSVSAKAGVADISREKCGDATELVLYAIRVFVPVLEAKEASGCSINRSDLRRAAMERWRLAETCYAAVGWIITPLVILTSSGLLKRHLER